MKPKNTQEPTFYPENFHSWNVTPSEAIAIQKGLKDWIIQEDQWNRIHLIAGVDVGYDGKNSCSRAAVALLSFPELELKEYATAQLPVSFPYIPGLLSFREVPVVLEAIKKLVSFPDLVICDGQGLAHPRRFGLACHIGLLTGLPTIGAAKSRLCGTHSELGENKGSWVPLLNKGEVIGIVLRTRTAKKPLYVSIGHKVSLETAREYVLRCLTRYRLPETTRWAHKIASENFHAEK